MTNEEQKLREIEEGTPEIKRSELWNKIYSIVRQIPRENVNCDAMDASSASSEIERMVTALINEWYVSKEKAGYPKEFVEWIGDDCSPCYLGREEDDYGKWVVFKRGSMEHEAEFDTLDELFNYWEENEQ